MSINDTTVSSPIEYTSKRGWVRCKIRNNANGNASVAHCSLNEGRKMNLPSIFGTTVVAVPVPVAVAAAAAAVESAPTMKAQHNDCCNDSSVKVELQHNLSLQQQWRHNRGLCASKLLSDFPCSVRMYACSLWYCE